LIFGLYCNASALLQSGKTYFYIRKKAFLQLWHDSFTVVEKHFYIRKNKFCCWEDDKMDARMSFTDLGGSFAL